MLSIQDPELLYLKHQHFEASPLKSRIHRLAILDLAFRSFFLLAVIGSAIALSMWMLWLNGVLNAPKAGLSVLTLHMHEMIFGFAATVAAGFLLTAVQTWTGQPGVKGASLALLIMLWLSVRVSLYAGTNYSVWVAVGLQTLWWFLTIASFARLLIKSSNQRNYVFIPILCVLMLLNIGLLVSDVEGRVDLSQHLARTAILMFCVLMGLLGGRVIPFFTVSGANIQGITSPSWITPITLISALSGAAIFFLGKFIHLSFSPAGLMITTGLLHLIRLSYWRSSVTYQYPLLWSLHLSYFAMALGLILLGVSYHIDRLAFGDALHILTIGAMGLMIFAMMSRVSLGHTGRPLQPKPHVIWLFIIIFSAACLRFVLPLLNHPSTGWNISAVMWLLGCVLFIWAYLPILVSPKQRRA